MFPKRDESGGSYGINEHMLAGPVDVVVSEILEATTPLYFLNSMRPAAALAKVS